MKATVNYNLEGDEEPGVSGRAQNVKFTISWACSQIPGLQLPCFKTIVFTRFSPHWHPRSTSRSQSWPPLVPPCLLDLNLESNLHPIWYHVSLIRRLMTQEKATTNLQCQTKKPSMSQGSQNHEPQSQADTHV